MKAIYVGNATGFALNWMVAKCVDEQGKRKDWTPPNYSTDWAQGGPIIEREGVGIWLRIDGDDDHKWMADDGLHQCTGPTPLVAAMRCYVMSKLGIDVEVPDELLQNLPAATAQD